MEGGRCSVGSGISATKRTGSGLQESRGRTLERRRDRCVSIEMTAYVTLFVWWLRPPKRRAARLLLTELSRRRISDAIDNHAEGRGGSDSGRKIIMLKWIVFSQPSLRLEAPTVKQNRKQMGEKKKIITIICRIFSWLGETGEEWGKESKQTQSAVVTGVQVG